MKLDNFNRADFNTLMTFVSRRNIGIQESGPGIIMRHDVDDNLERSVAMAEAEAQYKVKATYFILNTAPYWSKGYWDLLRYIESLGHEIAWHNNVITQWLKCDKKKSLDFLIQEVLLEFAEHGFEIKGSASHGDGMCYQYNYVNNQVFTAFPKAGLNGKPNELDYDQLEMAKYGLDYEAYAISSNVYLSESGKKWRALVKEKDLENMDNRCQILIHPQWWDLK